MQVEPVGTRMIRAGSYSNIQSKTSGHPAFYQNDYQRVLNQELQFRKELQYPPYGKMALIRVKGNQLEAG